MEKAKEFKAVRLMGEFDASKDWFAFFMFDKAIVRETEKAYLLRIEYNFDYRDAMGGEFWISKKMVKKTPKGVVVSLNKNWDYELSFYNNAKSCAFSQDIYDKLEFSGKDLVACLAEVSHLEFYKQGA